MTTYILPYVGNSMAAKALAEELGVKRLSSKGGAIRQHTRDDLVINWGKSGDGHTHHDGRVLNRPSALRHITHKLRFFQRMRDVGSDLMIPWTSSQAVVDGWLEWGFKVMARTKLTGHSGQGIVVINPDDGVIPDARLYTKYIPPSREYRIHFVRTSDEGGVYKTQMKSKKANRDNVMASEIQNHKNGYVYVINDVAWLSEDTWDVVKYEVSRVFNELQFGAVDLLIDETGHPYILEINAAPGLKSPTLKEFYRDAFAKRIEWEEENN